MLKKSLTLAALAASLSFATGWEYANPSYGGNAQIRTGIDINHEDEAAVAYTKARVVIKENVELMASVTDNQVDWVSARVDILDHGAVGVELHNDYAIVALQGYGNITDNVAVGGEANYNTDTKEVGVALEGDSFLFGHVQYVGATYNTDKTFSPYVGYALPVGPVDLGLCYYSVIWDGDYITSGYSIDVTVKF